MTAALRTAVGIRHSDPFALSMWSVSNGAIEDSGSVPVNLQRSEMSF